MKPPFSYPGSAVHKSKVLLDLLPASTEYDSYVEPFAGSASTYFALKHEPRHVVLGDTNEDLINFLIQLRDNKQRLISLIKNTYWSEVEFKLAQEPTSSPIERARRFYVRMQMARRPFDKNPSFKNQYKVARRKDGTGPMTMASTRFANLDRLTECQKKLRGVHITNADAFTVMSKYTYGRALFILDPPFLSKTRKNKKLYKNEDGDNYDWHIDFLRAANRLVGFAVIFGLYSETYDYWLKYWHRHDFRTRHDSGKLYKECFWFNYDV